MRLCEHRDFDQAILAAEEHFRDRGLRASIIEKDYYVTEALRLVAEAAPGHLIFKGGTSLSKGWDLIHRFSEDLDLFLDPTSYEPVMGGKKLDRALKQLRDAASKHPALIFLPGESQTIGGFGRSDRFSYKQRFGGPGAIANRILLETGTASGRQPTEVREISSYVGAFLAATGKSLGATDEQPFRMPLLHFRRTFVEKLFAIHAKVELLKTEGRPLGPYARHYYDLYQLAEQPSVVAMLRSEEYEAIRTDYDRVSRKHFPRDYRPPPDMRFSSSDALFATGSLLGELQDAYESQCKLLCYGDYPSWEQVLDQFHSLRQLV